MSLDQLTKRQREVCQGVYNGNTLIEIGLALGISPKTVSAHKEKAFKKLGAFNNVQFTKLVKDTISGSQDNDIFGTTEESGNVQTLPSP